MSEFNINEIREKIGTLGELKIQELAKSNPEVKKLLGEATSENGLVEFLEEMNTNNDDSITQSEIETYATEKGSVGNLQSLIEGIKNIFAQIMSAVSENKPTDETPADAPAEVENVSGAPANTPETDIPETDIPAVDVPVDEATPDVDVPTSNAPVTAPPANAPVVGNAQDVIDAETDNAKANAAADSTLETLTINKKTYTKDIKNNDAIKNHPPVETISLPAFNPETSKYLDPSYQTALSEKQARIKALNEEILAAMQKEQNDYMTKYQEIENAKKKLAELEDELKKEGISDEDKVKLKADISSLEKFINGGMGSLDSSIGSIASKIQERTDVINESKEIVKAGDAQAKQISDLVGKAQGVNLDSKIAEVNKIEVKKPDGGVDVSGDRKNYYFPEDEKNVNDRNKDIATTQVQIDTTKKALEDNNAKLKNDQTSLSKVVGNIANMSGADKTKALNEIAALAGGILTSGDKVGVDIDNLKNTKVAANAAVEAYNSAVNAANANINTIKKAIEDAKKVQFEDDVDSYAKDIKVAEEETLNTTGERKKYYDEGDDKEKVRAKRAALEDARSAADDARFEYNKNNRELKNNKENLNDLIKSLPGASSDAKTAVLNEIMGLAGAIINSKEVIQGNINDYKEAKPIQSAAVDSYNETVKLTNGNIDKAIKAAEKAATAPGVSSGLPASSEIDGSKIEYSANNGGITETTTDKNGEITEKDVKSVDKIKSGDGIETSIVTYDDGAIMEIRKNKDGEVVRRMLQKENPIVEKENPGGGITKTITYDDGKTHVIITDKDDKVIADKLEVSRTKPAPIQGPVKLGGEPLGYGVTVTYDDGTKQNISVDENSVKPVVTTKIIDGGRTKQTFQDDKLIREDYPKTGNYVEYEYPQQGGRIEKHYDKDDKLEITIETDENGNILTDKAIIDKWLETKK